jgi:hypothetical protein
MRSLGTFASTPTGRKKLRRSGAPKSGSSAPASTRPTTPDLFDEPVTDRGRQRDRSPGSQRSRYSSHYYRTGSFAPTSTRPTTPVLSNEPVADRDHQHQLSSGSQRSRHSSHHRGTASPTGATSISPLRHGNKHPASRSPSPAVHTKRGKVAQWHNGRAPQGRAKARDYEDAVYRGIVQACHDFEARVGAQGAWPEPDVQITWAREAWSIVCKDIGEYELTDRMLGLVCDR